MGLFELYPKEKANFFCLIKLLYIKVKCVRNVMLCVRLILKDKGGKQYVYHLLVLTWGFRYF